MQVLAGFFYCRDLYYDFHHTYSHREVMPVQVIYITAVLLFVAIFPLPLEYYPMLKVVAAGTFAWGAYSNFLKKTFFLPLLYTLFAVVFNPIVEINLAKELWIPINIVAAILLIATKNHIAE
jgi:hypothetical protein